MNTFEAYKTYLALRLHFTTKYDIRKTKGHVKASTATLDKNQKLLFELQKLKRKYNQRNFINYLVANFVNGDKYGGIYNPEAEQIYLAWLAVHDALTYKYKVDLEGLSLLVSRVEDLWDSKSGHPVLLKRCLAKTTLFETAVILNKLYGYRESLDAVLVHDPIWEPLSTLLDKYSPFVVIDKPHFLTITQGVFA